MKLYTLNNSRSKFYDFKNQNNDKQEKNDVWTKTKYIFNIHFSTY